MEEYLTYLKKFQIAVAIIILSLVVVGFLISKTIPKFQDIKAVQDNYTSKMKSLSDTERRLADLKDTIAKEKAEEEQAVKGFYKPMNKGVDTDTAISEEFNEILQLLRENKVKTRTLDFQPDPQDDNFVKHVHDKYYVSLMKADMIATYSNFENFLRDLYKHEHFLEISRIEVTPYSKNKRILLVNLQVKLYAQKDESAPSDFGNMNANPQNNVSQPPNISPAQQEQPSQPEVAQPPQSDAPVDDSSQYTGDEMTRKHKVYEDKVR